MLYVPLLLLGGAMPKETGDNNAGDISVDVRLNALALMTQALAQIDSDSGIPAIVGAHLQTAIDSLERHCPIYRAPIILH